MIISFLFPENPVDIEVELFDNPAIASWKRHFLDQSFEAQSHVITNIKPLNYDKEKITMLFDRCMENIKQLAEHGYPYNQWIPANIDEINRTWCNEAHRFFTHTQQHINHIQFPNLSFDEHVALQKRITDFLQQLNDDIHDIEDFYPPQAHGPVDFNADEIYCSKFPTYDDPGWWQMKPEWRKYHTSDYATVIFGPQILGKAISRSYLDGDNPNDWDTTGHYCNNGTLLIQVSDFRERLYNSQPFKDWLSKWGMTPDQAFYDFPVGTIQDLELLQDVYRRIKTSTDPIKTIYRP